MLYACTGEEAKYHIGISQCAKGGWRELMNEDMRREAILYSDIKTTLKISDDDAAMQIRQIDSLIDMGVDLLIISPTNAHDLVASVEKAERANIPVVLVDRKVDSDKYTVFVGGNNKGVGKMAADYIAASEDKPLMIYELEGDPSITPVQERHEGFTSALISYGIPYISKECYWDPAIIEAAVDSILDNNLPCDYIFCHNDGMNFSVMNSLKKHGKMGSINIIGVDGWLDEGVSMVEKGELKATIFYPTGGLEAMRSAVLILHGKSYEKEISLSPMVIDKINAESFRSQYEHKSMLAGNIDALGSKLNEFLMQFNLQHTLLLTTISFLVILFLMLVVVIRAWYINVKLRKQVERMSNDKLAFFTNVSHDFRTPLTLIADPLRQMTQHPVGNEHTQRLVQVAYKNVTILLRLINQVLDFRKYEAGAMNMRLTSFDLHKSLTEWTEAFVVLADSKSINFSVTFDNAEPIPIIADAEKLERLTYNILSNAFKFTDHGGRISLRVSLPAKGSEHAGHVQLRFSDTGLGMNQEQISHLFEQFFHANVHFAGTGIGLALVKAFVDMHHGTIDVQSQPNVGTTFIINLPLHQKGELATEDTYQSPVIDNLREGAVLTASRTISDDTDPASDSLPTILVIDDNEDIRTYIHLQLQPYYNVLEATDGTAGLIAAVHEVPDIIICDVMMPGISGIETLRQLKSDIKTSHIPVLMLTASTNDITQTESYLTGADAFMAKPFNSQVLMARVQNLLNTRKRLQAQLIDGSTSSPTGTETTQGEQTQTAATATDKQQTEQEKAPIQLLPIDKRFIERLATFVDSNIGNSDLKVDEMASEFSLAHTQFYRKVKALTGYSPNEYLRLRRLKHSRHLLTTTDLSVAEITYMVGFTSPSYFTKCFRETYGTAPTDFRANAE